MVQTVSLFRMTLMLWESHSYQFATWLYCSQSLRLHKEKVLSPSPTRLWVSFLEDSDKGWQRGWGDHLFHLTLAGETHLHRNTQAVGDKALQWKGPLHWPWPDRMEAGCLWGSPLLGLEGTVIKFISGLRDISISVHFVCTFVFWGGVRRIAFHYHSWIVADTLSAHIRQPLWDSSCGQGGHGQCPPQALVGSLNFSTAGFVSSFDSPLILIQAAPRRGGS